MGRGAGNLPLPADMPHCGNYHTHYDQIFAGRPSPEAQELAALLPLRYAELKDAAAAVTRAEAMARTRSPRNDNSDGTGTLRALELLALRRRAFVQIARDYNRRIARYAELATPGEIGAERLIGMLIKRPARRPPRGRRRPAPSESAVAERDQSPPQTFATKAGRRRAAIKPATRRRDEAVQPASGDDSRGRAATRNARCW